MKLRIVKDGWPWIIGSPVLFGLAAALVWAMEGRALTWTLLAIGLLGGAFMLYFFRDPERRSDAAPELALAGADGLVRAVEIVPEPRFLKTDAVRISIFLSPFNVHVNRAPVAGTVRHLDYSPGRHLLTLDNRASEVNEHSTILIEGEMTRCLVRQIVGPIVRRVVYWLTPDQRLARGERIGMMKFGSRLDMYFPAAEVEALVKKGDRVRAGWTPVARRKSTG